MNDSNKNRPLSLAEKNVASHQKESHYFKILLIVGGVILIIVQILSYFGSAKRAELQGIQHETTFTFNSTGIASLIGSNIFGLAGIISVVLGIVGLIRQKKQPKQ